MRTLPRLFAAVLAAISIVGCGDTVDRDVAATVDDTDIRLATLEDSVVTLVGNPSELSAEERAEMPRYQREFLGFFIQDLVYQQALAAEGIALSDEDWSAALEAEIEGLGGPDAYEDQLAEYGVTLELFETLVRLDAMTNALRDHVLDDQLARAIRHILVETEDEALEVIEELEAGAAFGELAAERSQDPGSADAGGEYPPAPRGQWVPEFDEAVWAAEIGELVGPVETMHGYHVIEVLEETELDTDQMDPQQLEQLTAGQVGAILEDAFQTADVAVSNAIGRWDATTRQVVPQSEEVGVAPDGPPEQPQLEE